MLLPAVFSCCFLFVLSCDPAVEWMNCDSSAEPAASWHQSWHALERAYAEGQVSSIGVSNFDVHQLAEFESFGTVLPHVVQASAQVGPGSGQMALREWCWRHAAVFVPHTTQAKMKDLPGDVRAVVHSTALTHAVSPNAIISRFFIQSGTLLSDEMLTLLACLL